MSDITGLALTYLAIFEHDKALITLQAQILFVFYHPLCENAVVFKLMTQVYENKPDKCL